MSTSTVGISDIELKDAYGLWFKPGDSFSVAMGKGSYTGFITSNKKAARCVIPLTKPVKPGTTVKVSGDFRIRTADKDDSPITVTNLNCTVTDCGLAVDIGIGTDLGAAGTVCSVGVNTNGITITFS